MRESSGSVSVSAMTRYNVSATVSQRRVFEIYAESAEEAMEFVKQDFELIPSDIMDQEISDVDVDD